MWTKMKMWISTHKKLLIAVGIIIALAVGVYLALHLTGYDNLEYIQNWLKNFGIGYAIALYLLISVTVTVFLCFVPGTSMAFILLAVALFGANWKTFLISATSVLLSSCIMYFIGRFGGVRLMNFLIGSEEMEKAADLIRKHGQVYFPIMMACGGFPDDALVCVAGTIRMNLAFFLPSVIVGRSIGIATIVFGFQLIPFGSFTTFYDWFVFVACCIAYIALVLKIGGWINKKINHL